MGEKGMDGIRACLDSWDKRNWVLEMGVGEDERYQAGVWDGQSLKLDCIWSFHYGRAFGGSCTLYRYTTLLVFEWRI
jgi:hypothetical protein